MNKKLVLIFVLFSFSLFGFSQKMQFKETKYNFGFVHEGDTVRINYEFKNTGDSTLVITDYTVGCGCTVMETPDSPVKPGESYVLKVRFDTHEKYDRQDRTVTIISNAVNSPVTIRFKGVVLKPKKE